METDQKRYDVLVIEDDPSTISLLKDFFEMKGYTCYGTSSGQKALDQLDQLNPKLILIDIILPDLDGYAICKEVRDNIKFKNVKIMYITAKSEEEIRQKVEETGADGYLLKPFELPKVEHLTDDL